MAQAASHRLPECEIQRLATLDDYRVLDTAPDQGLDTIIRHATRVFAVPIALVSLVAEDRQYFKARIGVDVCEAAREGSFCSQTILGRDVNLGNSYGIETIGSAERSVDPEEMRHHFYTTGIAG